MFFFLGCSPAKKGSLDHQSKSIKILRFTRLFNKIDTGLQYKIAAFLIIDTAQKQSQNGIHFSIKLVNDSTGNLVVNNPLDFLHISLWNDSKINIIPEQPSRYKIDRKDSFGFSYTAFNIEKVVINNSSSNINLNSEKYIHIPSKGEYEIYLSVRDALKTNGNEKPLITNEKIPIDKGNYQLLISLGIAMNKKLENLTLNLIPINYY